MKRYVAVYGGTDLDPETAEFVALLVRTILERTEVTLVTGGYKHPVGEPQKVSANGAARRGAVCYAREKRAQIRGEHREQLKERLETWLPLRKDNPDTVRFRSGTVRMLPGTLQARRFRLVNDVSALVTVKGKKQTELLLELAFALGRPVLPLPFTGGDSRAVWVNKKGEPNEENQRQIQDWFGISDELAHRLLTADLETLPAPEQKALAEEIADAVRHAIRRRCLVLRQYGESDSFYASLVEPAIMAAGFQPIDIRRDHDTGHILGIFLERLADCDSVIADVTEGNPNVMYELGHAHARGINPLLYSRRGEIDTLWKDLPFYLRELKVEAAGSDAEREALGRTIREYLRDADAGRFRSPVRPL